MAYVLLSLLLRARAFGPLFGECKAEGAIDLFGPANHIVGSFDFPERGFVFLTALAATPGMTSWRHGLHDPQLPVIPQTPASKVRSRQRQYVQKHCPLPQVSP